MVPEIAARMIELVISLVFCFLVKQVMFFTLAAFSAALQTRWLLYVASFARLTVMLCPTMFAETTILVCAPPSFCFLNASLICWLSAKT